MQEVIAVEALSRSYGAVRALDGVTFTVHGPQVVGLLGPNGAGKTTLLSVLEGLAAPDTGVVRLFGAPLAPYPRRRVGVVLQREAALERMTAGDYAELFAAIYAVPGGGGAILAAAGLTHRARVPFERLSGGEAQWLAIHAVCAHGPDLLLLDEPTAHLDPPHRRAIGETLRAMGRTRTVLLSTHDLAEAEAVCDHLIFLESGRVRASGPTRELTAGRPLAEAFFQYCGAHIGADGGRA